MKARKRPTGPRGRWQAAEERGDDGYSKMPPIPMRKIDLYLGEDTKISPRYSKGIHVKDKTVKLLEENIREDYLHAPWARGISETRHKGQTSKVKSDTFDYIKTKIFCSKKTCLKKVKNQPHWEKVFPTHTTKKDQYLEYINNF